MSTEYQVHLSKSEEGMDYHIFKKPIKSKNKTIHRWYYYFTEPISGKMIQRVCKGCKTQAEAYAYVLNLYFCCKVWGTDLE